MVQGCMTQPAEIDTTYRGSDEPMLESTLHVGPNRGRCGPVGESDNRRFRVALVDEELPYPANSGKRIRALNLVTRLARKHDITYLCHRNADAAEARLAADHLAGHGIATIVVDRVVPPRSGLGFYARLAANVFSPLPYSVASHDSVQLRQAIRAHAANNKVDLWQCEWTPYSAALSAAPGPVIVHTQNVEAAIWRRYAETESNPVRRWYLKQQWLKYQRFERAALARADRAVAVSELDARTFRVEYGIRRIDVVENGVDTAYFRPAGTPRDAKRLLFLGSLDWRPNLDGVGQLLDAVFPAVRAAEPEARLVLVGRQPPAWLRARAARQPGVELHADVADVRPFLASAGMMVVPLRIGGGSRIKILEALASGLPVVSTRVGAEGLDLVPGTHLVVVGAIPGLIGAVVRAIRRPAELAAQAADGRRAVLAKYDWDRLATRLEQTWAACLAERVRPSQRGAA
jgi:glycosyltransferase involved in cell wall biosynthesis